MLNEEKIITAFRAHWLELNLDRGPEVDDLYEFLEADFDRLANEIYDLCAQDREEDNQKAEDEREHELQRMREII